MAKTSNGLMIDKVRDVAWELTKGDGQFRTSVLQDEVESSMHVRPGEDFVAKCLSERYDLVAGTWQRKPSRDSGVA